MSTVKISQLAPIPSIRANTSNTIMMGVDIPTGITGKFTAKTLARDLYANEVLNVGNNAVTLPNTVAQFALSSESYIQTNLVNNNNGGTADMVITANTGTDTSHFIDLGFANKDFVPGSEYNSLGTALSPLDGYLYVQGGTSDGNLVIGTTISNTDIKFIAGGGTTENVIARITANGLVMMNHKSIYFTDGTVQVSSSASAGDYANAAFNKTNSAYLMANTPSYTANSAAQYANSAFNKANSSYVGANAAFIQANAAFDLANTASFYSPIPAFTQANAAFLKANSAYSSQNITGTYANTAYDQANSAAQYANSAFVKANSAYSSQNTTGLVANSAATYANGAFIQANAAFLVANTPTHVANSAALYANASFIKANSAYESQNTTGTYANSAYDQANSAAQYGNTAFNYANSAYVKANSAYTIATSANGQLAIITPVAQQAYTWGEGAVQNTSSILLPGSLQVNGNLTVSGAQAHFTGVVNPEKGFIYLPRILHGAQTAITIDFSTDSMIRGTFSAGITNSFTNYVPGKVVEVWLTNTAGNGQTVTHGCLANNSTIGSTTQTVAAGRTIHLRYFSIDGDLGNTFVAVTYA